MLYWGNLDKLGGFGLGGVIVSWVWLNIVVGSEEDIKLSNSFVELCLLIGGVFGEVKIVGYGEDFECFTSVIGVILQVCSIESKWLKRILLHFWSVIKENEIASILIYKWRHSRFKSRCK